MTNIETLLVSALNRSASFQTLKAAGQSKIEAFLDVPANRPVRFVTIERTSGGEADLVDRPVVAVQFWAESRLAASEGAHALQRLIDMLPALEPLLGKSKVESVYNFPDERQARYQLTVSASTVRG